MRNSYERINERLARGEAVVVTADEFKAMAQELSPSELAARVDVVTTGTFAPMCSSGVLLNFGHASPPIRMERITLNGVPAYEGLAAVDAYLGATAVKPSCTGFCGPTGGADVIEALVRGEEVLLEAEGKGTDCYPRRSIATAVSLARLNEAWLLNPRNGYQNYGAATNSAKRRLATYMGVLEPSMGSVSYSTSGELSPLLNDPECRTIGVGSPVFLCGARGRVIAPGTQYRDCVPHNAHGIPLGGARTLALIADLKEADPEFLAAAHYSGYGTSLFVGLGIPIPVLDEDMAVRLSIRDADIETEARDYALPDKPVVARYSYAALRSGRVELAGRLVPTSSLSSIARARRVAAALKAMVLSGKFPVAAPLEPFPAARSPRALEERPFAPQPSRAEAGRGPARYLRGRCVDCGACAAHCPTGALAIGAPDWELRYDDSVCAGCGACFAACPRGALGGAGSGNCGKEARRV